MVDFNFEQIDILFDITTEDCLLFLDDILAKLYCFNFE